MIADAWRIHDRLAARLSHGPGSVFTPRAVAQRLAALTLSPLHEAPKLVDPACGAGALLIGAVEWAANERPEWLDAWRRGGLVGWDVNAGAVDAANAALAAALGADGEWASVRDGLTQRGSFDAVLANPPWVSYSGRQAGRLSPTRRAELASRFRSFAGWPALHTAFAEQCARLARRDSGRLGLLLPMQVADLSGYAALREAVTAHHGLEHALDLGERAFDGVTEPCGLFVFGAGGSSRPWLTDESADVLARARRFRPLPAASFGDVGVHTGNAGKLLVAREGAGRPLRVGRDVTAFKLAPPSHVLRDVELPEGRYARVAAEGRYRDARILLRQTASRPIAAKHAPRALFRNSVLACYGAPGHDDDFLLGVLNSDVVADLHRASFRDARQKAFPQLKMNHLRALPVPGREIGTLYTRIANASRAVQAGDPSAGEELARLVEWAYLGDSLALT